jgi:hypothetical protein
VFDGFTALNPDPLASFWALFMHQSALSRLAKGRCPLAEKQSLQTIIQSGGVEECNKQW